MPKAIDVHVHAPAPPGHPPSPVQQQMREYFKTERREETLEQMAERYQKLDIFAVLLNNNSQSARGELAVPNDYFAQIVRKYPKTFAFFAGVDPWAGKMAVKEIERAVKDLGAIGVKFVPMTQEFFLNEHRFYPMYEKCAKLGVPIMVHSGTTGVGAGLPGGGGIRLKYTKPIPYMDDVAADFPELTVIMAHPAFPWQDEQLAMCVHKPNVYMDMSGWSPKYFSPLLIQYANSLIQDKVMFGSDYAMIYPERWLADFEAAPFRPEVRPKILVENAKRILRLPI